MFWEVEKEEEKSKKWKFTDKQIEENLATLIIGSYINTVSAMTSTIHILSSRPDIVHELRNGKDS